jgi:sugar phosphate isomerase/epimerase
VQAQILLTLSVGSLKTLVDSGEVPLEDVPAFAMREFDLRGLNIPASMFAGCSIEVFDRLRDNADKAGCPVLILVEEQPLLFAFETDEQRDATLERINRLAIAANRLGCNSLAVSCLAPRDDEDTFELTVDGIKDAIGKIEQFDLNLLLAPTKGLTHEPDRMTDLIKRVGGFRIGSFPSFGHAERTKDPNETLRKLAPYAGGIEATISTGKKGVDIGEAIDSILSVGYLNTLSINLQTTRKRPMDGIRAARRSLAEALGQLDEEDLEALLEEEFPDVPGATEGDDASGSVQEFEDNGDASSDTPDSETAADGNDDERLET